MLVGAGEGFFIPAFGGMIPLVVEAPLLPSANALVGIARQGSTLIVMSRFDFEGFLKAIETYRVSRLYIVPPIVLALSGCAADRCFPARASAHL